MFFAWILAYMLCTNFSLCWLSMFWRENMFPGLGTSNIPKVDGWG